MLPICIAGMQMVWACILRRKPLMQRAFNDSASHNSQPHSHDEQNITHAWRLLGKMIWLSLVMMHTSQPVVKAYTLQQADLWVQPTRQISHSVNSVTSVMTHHW